MYLFVPAKTAKYVLLQVIPQYTTTIPMHDVKCTMAPGIVLDALIILMKGRPNFPRKQRVPRTCALLEKYKLQGET